jgi:hypothetical protein
MLDMLQTLQSGLLIGGIPIVHLNRLRALVTQNRTTNSDPKLKQILDDIELRVEVELAKLSFSQ